MIKFFIERPFLCNVVSFGILLVGLIKMLNTRLEVFPNVDFDVVSITTLWPGSSPDEVEQLITTAIEQELKPISGIKEYQGTSLEGRSNIVVFVDPDTSDKAQVKSDVQRAVDRVKTLPEDAEDPVVTIINSKLQAVLEIAVGGLPMEELRPIAKKLGDHLDKVQGVAQINKKGYPDDEIRILLNPSKMRQWHVSINEVSQALKTQNVDTPAGAVETGTGDIIVRTLGRFRSVEEIENTVIRSNVEGNAIFLKDIATVENSFVDLAIRYRANGSPSIILSVVKKENEDILNLRKNLAASIQEFKASPGLTIDFINDMSVFVERRLGVLKGNLLLGVCLVTLLLLVFLRPSLVFVIMVGIPTAFAITFITMPYFDITINLISLFGFILVSGMIVDDAIVVVENIFRKIEDGLPPRQAAYEGTKEVIVPIMGSIATTVLAFGTLLQLSGVMGKFIWAIPAIVIIALFASVIESFLFAPSHTSEWTHFGEKLMKKFGKTNRTQTKDRAAFLWVSRIYLKFVRFAVYKKYRTALMGIAFIIVSFVVFAFNLKFVLFPAVGIEIFQIRVKAEAGTNKTNTAKQIIPIEKIVEKLNKKELKNYVTQFGIIQNDPNDPFTERGGHVAQLTVYLTAPTERERDVFDIIKEIEDQIPGDKFGFESIIIQPLKGGPPIGKPLSVNLIGDDYARLKELSTKVQDRIKDIPGIKGVGDNYVLAGPEYRVRVLPNEAKKANLSVEEVGRALRVAIGGMPATTVTRSGEEVDVVVKFADEFKTSPDEVFSLVTVSNMQGNLVPLKNLVKFEKSRSIVSLSHIDGERTVNVYGDLNEDVILPAEAFKKTMAVINEFKPSYPDVRIATGGENRDNEESIKSFKTAAVISILSIFLMLVGIFGNFVQPFLVVTSIPFSLLGVGWILILQGYLVDGKPLPVSFLGLIGIIGLAGVIVNNAIVLIDFVNSARKAGMDKNESIIHAGVTRLRPVILTTFTTIFGILPTAYGIGGLDHFIQPMALVFGWGLFGGAFFTMIMIPCFTSIADDFKSFTERNTSKLMGKLNERFKINN